MTNKTCILFVCFITLLVPKSMAQVIVDLSSGDTISVGLKEGQTEDNYNWVENIQQAEMWIYAAPKDNNTHKAVLICPGGGYAGVAFKHEGIELAKWLNEQGVTAVVLKYRMPNGRYNIPISDAHEAITYMRKYADELNVDDQKIGIAGFSAGGHLAAITSTGIFSKDEGDIPNFSILFYPVISMGDDTHKGSRSLLLGNTPSEEDIDTFSADKQVKDEAPPAILFLSSDDAVVPPSNSISYYQSLLANQRPASMHIFPTGGHGWGMNENFKYHKQVLDLLANWLQDVDN